MASLHAARLVDPSDDTVIMPQDTVDYGYNWFSIADGPAVVTTPQYEQFFSVSVFDMKHNVPAVITNLARPILLIRLGQPTPAGDLNVVERHLPDPALARRLAHLRFRLDGVEPWSAGMSIPTFDFTRLNERYRAALALARLILKQRSLEFPDQTQRGSAFLFNMNHVFEKYVEAELRRALEGHGGRVDGQRETHLDEADTVLMKPDVTWWSGDHCLAVIDAKYKRTTSDDYPNADAYQMRSARPAAGSTRGCRSRRRIRRLDDHS